MSTNQLEVNSLREQLYESAPILDLPFDHRRVSKPSYEYGQAPFQIPADVARPIEKLAEQEGAGLSSAFLAAFAILVSRYGNAQEVLVGVSGITGHGSELQYVIGDVAQCDLVVRVNCAPEQSFTKLVHQVSRQGQTLQALDVAPHAAYDLALRIRTQSGGIAPSLLYRNDLFDLPTIQRMSRHFVRLLQSIASTPDTPISELDMMPDEERALVLGDYSGSSVEYPRRCLHELFAEQAALRPDAEALVFGAERLTYRQLDQRSNQVAQFLRQQGLQHEDRVGIFMDRSIGMVVSMLGILKAGGAYVPIDPDYPAERLKFIADDTDVRCVFTEKTVRSKLPTSAPLVYVDDPDSAVARCSNEPVPNISTPESIAVAIYTSGSTGKPKAACIPHRAAVRLVRNTNFVQATSADRVSQVSSPSFDAAILEIWSALTNGATLIGIRKEVLLDPSEVTKLLQAERVTILFVNTAYVHRIGRDAPEVLKGPRKIMFGGEAAEPGPLRNILRHVPPGTLVNLYGPAENSVVSSAYEIQAVSEDCVSIPIGRPIANTRMYLLDKCLHPVPIGLQGEIYVGGDGVARGYWNRPELTAQRFIPDPFSDRPGALLYRTGDLARLRENGEFEFNGRIDDQIKIRGHRIELAEVREAIASHADVKQVALMVREDKPGDRQLVAYVTLRQPLQSASELLRLHVKQKLPAHMVPAAFVILDSIPLNTNGKVDRKALPPPSSRTEAAAGYSAPKTSLERILAKVWHELLGVDRIGVNDNFFDLGGHSLLAARLVAHIEKETGQNIPVATLFEAPTIAELAQKLQDHTYTSAWAPLVELRAPAGAPAAEPFFCIHSMGANLVSFRKLASLLRADRAVYGLQPHGLDGKQRPLDTVDAMAAAYLEEIRTKQAHGPYYLGGICLGGIVAYDVAQRLKAAGEEVRLLALIDSFLPGELRYLHTRSELAEYLDFHLGEIWLQSGTNRLKYFARWFGNGFIRLAWALGFRARDSVARATRNVAHANTRAMLAYTPRPYAGAITQLMCSDWAQRSYEDRRLAWSSLAEGGLEIHIVPGNHLTMVEEPHVRVLAEQLQACLDRADGLALPALNSQHRPEGEASKQGAPNPKQRAADFSPGLPLSV